MPIITIQRRLHERGRIRIGEKVAMSGGRTRPSKLDRFRLTSADHPALEQAADLWGGDVAEWDSPNGRQWQLITETTDLPVVVPPADFGFSQFMELWSGGGCQRRCDTQTELISGGPCVCAEEDEQTCKPTTRLSVLLPDLPGLGLWRLETHGWNAAAELAGTVELIAGFGAGRLIPARLRLQQRSSIVDGKTSRFAVPVLDIDVRMGELTQGARSADELLSPDDRPALPSPSLTPVPARQEGLAPPPIEAQLAEVDDPAPRPRRANAQAPIPPTGLKPKPAAAAQPLASGGPSCVRCGGSLAGQAVAKTADGYVHKDGCPEASSGSGDPAPDKEVGKAARKAFADAYDNAAHGDKSRTLDQLRHALTYAVTGGRAWHLRDLTGDERRHLLGWLHDVAEGWITYEHDDDAVIFTVGDQQVPVLFEQVADAEEGAA